jgi:hypothetical protein
LTDVLLELTIRPWRRGWWESIVPGRAMSGLASNAPEGWRLTAQKLVYI